MIYADFQEFLAELRRPTGVEAVVFYRPCPLLPLDARSRPKNSCQHPTHNRGETHDANVIKIVP